MWQSSGKYVPTVSQLKEVAPAIIGMGCFDRVETNGGAFEQVNLLFGENPNRAVREWTAPFNKAGIQTHMLERGLNALRMNPVPADVRELMYKVKCKQGTNISRSFCGLNDHRNLRLSVEYAKKGGMISQVALSITNSPIHTVEYYMGIVDKVVEYGCDEICLKDMAGIGRPTMLGELTRSIKKKYPHIKIQYHGHCGPGFSPASMLEVARAGADYLDVAVEPLSWGKVHPDVITIREMMKADGFLVKDLNMDAYMEVRRLTQKFIDEFLGYWIDPNNSHMSSLLVGCGLPGGMMGSMMADLKGFHGAINASLRAQGKQYENTKLTNDIAVVFFCYATVDDIGNKQWHQKIKKCFKEFEQWCKDALPLIPLHIFQQIFHVLPLFLFSIIPDSFIYAKETGHRPASSHYRNNFRTSFSDASGHTDKRCCTILSKDFAGSRR